MRILVFDKSSPVQPVSDFRGGSTSVTEDGGWRRTEQEILVSNIGFDFHMGLGSFLFLIDNWAILLDIYPIRVLGRASGSANYLLY